MNKTMQFNADTYVLVPMSSAFGDDATSNHIVLSEQSDALREVFPEMKCCFILVNANSKEGITQALHLDAQNVDETLAKIDYANYDVGVKQSHYFDFQKKILSGLAGFKGNKDCYTLNFDQAKKLKGTIREKFGVNAKLKPEDVVCVSTQQLAYK